LFHLVADQDGATGIQVPPEPRRRQISRLLLAIFFATAGANHFLHPLPYLAMMPPYLPRPELLNQAAGIAEILGGIGILIPQARRFSAWGLLALLVAVFPANLQVALHAWPGVDIPPWVLWARLPLQPVLMAWVYLGCLKRQPS
jgi:uncharacterized membrane protein